MGKEHEEGAARRRGQTLGRAVGDDGEGESVPATGFQEELMAGRSGRGRTGEEASVAGGERGGVSG